LHKLQKKAGYFLEIIAYFLFSVPTNLLECHNNRKLMKILLCYNNIEVGGNNRGRKILPLII